MKPKYEVHTMHQTGIMSLPVELHHMIGGMACACNHNAHPSSHGLVITVAVDFTKKIEGSLEDELCIWLNFCLKQAHTRLDPDTRWDYVGNVRVSQDEYKCDHGSDIKENFYQACVHFGQHNDEYDIGLAAPLFPYFYEENDAIDPEDVLQHFSGNFSSTPGALVPPVFVRGVTVSGVSELVVRDEWTECIAKESGIFDRDGKGYMEHPMYSFTESWNGGPECLETQREQSCNFGWPEYPGELGLDW